MELSIPQDIINDLGIPQIIDLRPELPVNPKYTWADLAGVRNLEDLTTPALHHDALKKADYAGVSDVELAVRIANNHIRLKANEKDGDAGFPYHVWIRSGQAYLCNDIVDRTYGIGGNNGYTVHVCVSGNYTVDTLSEEDRKCLVGVLLSLKRVLTAYTGIKAHCELNPTSCPGYPYQSVRDDVQTLEIRLDRAKTKPARREKAYKVLNQAQYMYGFMGKNDGNEEWALNWFEDFYQYLKSKDML